MQRRHFAVRPPPLDEPHNLPLPALHHRQRPTSPSLQPSRQWRRSVGRCAEYGVGGGREKGTIMDRWVLDRTGVQLQFRRRQAEGAAGEVERGSRGTLRCAACVTWTRAVPSHALDADLHLFHREAHPALPHHHVRWPRVQPWRGGPSPDQRGDGAASARDAGAEHAVMLSQNACLTSQLNGLNSSRVGEGRWRRSRCQAPEPSAECI